MMGLNKLGTAITVITAVTLTALTVEIIYLLFQRRRNLRPRVRVEPQEASSLPCSTSSASERDELEIELEHHVMKWQCLYGPSRVLFTIKEEDREGTDSENNAECSAVVFNKTTPEEVFVSMEGLVNETTPFSTPCASPPYYTPYSSPSRDAFKDINGRNG